MYNNKLNKTVVVSATAIIGIVGLMFTAFNVLATKSEMKIHSESNDKTFNILYDQTKEMNKKLDRIVDRLYKIR